MKKWNELAAVRAMWEAIYAHEKGWDGYEAQPVPRANIEYGLKLLDDLQVPYLEFPDIKAEFDGSITFTWEQNKMECVVSFHPVRDTKLSMPGANFSVPRTETGKFTEKAKPELRRMIINDPLLQNSSRTSM